MNESLTITLALFILASGFVFTQAYAEISPNNSLTMEGSGYLAAEKSIKTSSIDFSLNTGPQSGTTTSIDVTSGVVTINDKNYIIADSSATSLRDGKYIRISANAESPDRDEITINTLGRLVQDSRQGSIYTFSGRIIDENTTYKIIYTVKISDIISQVLADKTTESGESLTVSILKGASNKDITSTYIGREHKAVAGYFSMDWITLTPGDSILFVNDDDAQHTLVSGTGLGGTRTTGDLIVCSNEKRVQSGASYSQNKCDFILDGKLNSGVISPKGTWTATFSERGIYRLIDTDYPWMNLVVYVFPEPSSMLIKQGRN